MINANRLIPICVENMLRYLKKPQLRFGVWKGRWINHFLATGHPWNMRISNNAILSGVSDKSFCSVSANRSVVFIGKL